MELPQELDTPEFRKVWEEYQNMRREYRYPKWKDSTIKMNLKRFVEWGVDKAIEALETSTVNTWRGVFKPHDTARTNSNCIGPGQRYDPNHGEAEF